MGIAGVEITLLLSELWIYSKDEILSSDNTNLSLKFQFPKLWRHNESFVFRECANAK